ncbi:protein MpTRIHELIX1 [Marchantia polymorpha subsp. ruderalis]|uniref:Myb-like domain-containing protein n=4 Tax=Marchantia polymorpha TaxID=3197 RepID=A0AAF6AQZ1_MARPO|nr:hypothetical protein MARPO_0001s0020 [Marchantia polymorpha]PTQ49941.1 hypothetical protein MARPO_0001s0020 [Marchantia polymorpha]BBM98860.1 hypothetical protein Mp_1g16790 [Marchantia polymorpha subsp. ruderalis]BBM98861.1 hypothetical protein Mp_1g16790 [Marchantia polymorpha subsp. ruderalis]|eukprot:PTQ49939.1 hypothetical protein MARPO_0001s0020 [Marchantia polymorpha]
MMDEFRMSFFMEAGGEVVGDLGVDGEPVAVPIEQVDESAERQNRNPRWSQHETLVLVAAKKRQGEELSPAIPRPRNLTADERWELVAAYCKANGCERNAYQCRKRWFALYGDYKKVKEWQRSSAETYWGMKNDRRRENRLPGTFDRVVFQSMDSWLKISSDAQFDTPTRPDEGISSEIEQDVEGQELPDIARGDGNSIVPRSEQTGDLGDKRYRNPRWSLHESLILLAAKKKQEDDSGMAPKARARTVSADERWESISAHCRTNGCERNAYQCRKRWSALLGDFKRIREWQKLSTESYWLMKNEKRKENKLPAIFDYEVFVNMDSWVGKRTGKKSGAAPEFLDCARPANGRLFPDVEHDREGHLEPVPLIGGCQRNTTLAPEMGPTLREEMPSDSTARKKRKRGMNGDASDFKGQQLAAVFKSSVKAMQAALAENTQMQIQAHHTNIQAQIEAHNLNSQLDRTQRKEQGESLVGVLGKLAEALGKIAEKLV